MASWMDHHDRLLREHIAAGHSVRKIAAEMGFSPTQISRRSKAIGAQIGDPTRTDAAAKTSSANAKLLRAQLQIGFLEDAQKLRSQMFARATISNFGGKDNTYNERQIDEPLFADKLKIMQAATIAVDRSLRLAEHDSTGAEEARSLLRGIADAFGLRDDATDVEKPNDDA